MEGAIVEAPKAPAEWGVGRGCGEGSGRGFSPLPRKCLDFLS